MFLWLGYTFPAISEYCGVFASLGGLTGPRLSRGSALHALQFSLLNDCQWFVGDSLSVRHCAGNVRMKQSCLVLKAEGVAWRMCQQVIHQGEEEGMTTSVWGQFSQRRWHLFGSSRMIRSLSGGKEKGIPGKGERRGHLSYGKARQILWCWNSAWLESRLREVESVGVEGKLRTGYE